MHHNVNFPGIHSCAKCALERITDPSLLCRVQQGFKFWWDFVIELLNSPYLGAESQSQGSTHAQVTLALEVGQRSVNLSIVLSTFELRNGGITFVLYIPDFLTLHRQKAPHQPVHWTDIKLQITDPICSLARFRVAAYHTYIYISYFINLHKTPAQYMIYGSIHT